MLIQAIFFTTLVGCYLMQASPTPSEQAAINNLQEILNGIFENNNLPKPTTILDCFSPSVVEIGYNFINPIKIGQLQAEVDVANNEIIMNKCTRSNSEIASILLVFNIHSVDEVLPLLIRIQQYPFPFLNEIGKLNNLIEDSKYYAYGVEFSRFSHWYLPILVKGW